MEIDLQLILSDQSSSVPVIAQNLSKYAIMQEGVFHLLGKLQQWGQSQILPLKKNFPT
jgi:hypothetical protein